jgi:hypothetical protein
MTRENRDRRRHSEWRLAALTALTLGLAFSAHAQVNVPNAFNAGDKAVAAEVNENFAALASTIEALQARVDVLETQATSFAAIAQVITVSPDAVNGVAGPNVVIEGANLHVRSGSGVTDDAGTPTGLGNVIIGYNEVASGQQAGDRDGAHNLVMGRGNLFTGAAGIVAGEDNQISGELASVLGGRSNQSTGQHAVVGGGSFNRATGDESVVSGGVSNLAVGFRSAASGGAQNTANGVAASISGGSGGVASGFAASVTGGQGGAAAGDNAIVVGGGSNVANGNKAVVGGGFNQAENNDFSWRACGITCP